MSPLECGPTAIFLQGSIQLVSSCLEQMNFLKWPWREKSKQAAAWPFSKWKNKTLISWSWLAWAELRSLWSVFYNKSPVMITHAHQHHMTDLVGLMCVSILAPSTQSAVDGMCRAVPVLTYGEKQSRGFLSVSVSPVLGLPRKVESCRFMGLSLDLLIQNLGVRIPRCCMESEHP